MGAGTTADYWGKPQENQTHDTVKILKFQNCCKHQTWLCLRVMHPKDAEGIANSVEPDQTAPRSGSAPFAQTCLSENLGKLRYNTSILAAFHLIIRKWYVI